MSEIGDMVTLLENLAKSTEDPSLLKIMAAILDMEENRVKNAVDFLVRYMIEGRRK